MKSLKSTIPCFLLVFLAGCGDLSRHDLQLTSVVATSDAPASTSGFSVNYSKIPTSITIEQLWNTDTYNIRFDSLMRQEMQYSPELDKALGDSGQHLRHISLSGNGSVCTYAPEDPRLVSCRLSHIPVTFGAGEISVTATARYILIDVRKITRSSLRDDADGASYVQTDNLIEIATEISTDKGIVSGVVEFYENFGETVIQ